jgi:hypothetical protein
LDCQVLWANGEVADVKQRQVPPSLFIQAMATLLANDKQAKTSPREDGSGRMRRCVLI